jgi:hypothetical protein
LSRFFTPADMQLKDSSPEEDEWMAAMRRGDLERAWQISDIVLQERIAGGTSCWHMPRHLQYVWTGAPLAGKRVLVRCYHGLGDTIQFIRFAAPLREIAREVIVWVQPQLLDLVASAPGVDRVLPLHDDAPAVEYDVDIEVMELPHALRVARETLLTEVPYLFPPAVPLSLRSGLNVGIVWESGGWDSRRSVPLDLLRLLRQIPHVHLHSLQRGPARFGATQLTDSDISCGDVLVAASRMLQLDLVMSVDTMAAHLAGALGVPVWTLLHSSCDWRWMCGDRSVWYPTMRLFRQAVPGAWPHVIDEVCTALRDTANERSLLSSVVADTTA